MTKQKIKNKSEYKLSERKRMTETEREVITFFLKRYATASIRQTELRLDAREVRAFLEPYGMTFTRFNRLTSCLGRTTGNLYAYSIPTLLSLASPAYEKERKYRRRMQSDRIKTLNYYGSKRRWLREYTLLFQYIHDEYKCDQFVDCFAGSCVLSLLASKLGCFPRIIANEGSPSVYNYHAVMKGEATFEEFVRRIELTPHLNKESYRLISKSLHDEKNYNRSDIDDAESMAYEGREVRHQRQSVDVTSALNRYLVSHYAFQCQGGFSSDTTPVSLAVNALKDSHKLYEPIELTNLYYKKVLLRYIESEGTLILLDPPYLREVRVQKQSYGLEFSNRKHRTLIQLLSKREHASKIILCGYKGEGNGDLYSRYLLRSEAEWHCFRFLRLGTMQKNADGRMREHIWTNFNIEPLIKSHADLLEQVF